jgi:hypothetical protein
LGNEPPELIFSLRIEQNGTDILITAFREDGEKRSIIVPKGKLLIFRRMNNSVDDFAAFLLGEGSR